MLHLQRKRGIIGDQRRNCKILATKKNARTKRALSY
jgi:hypothetical protein